MEGGRAGDHPFRVSERAVMEQMMKTPLETARTRPYPHLVSTGDRRATRRTIYVANAPVPGIDADDDRAFMGVGMLDRRGELSKRGRAVVLAGIIDLARRTRLERCIVWAADDCSWISREGDVRNGRKPPVAIDTLDPYFYEQMPMEAEDCWTVPLPEGCDATHLCIRQIDATRIEICPGERIVLGDFSDKIPDGERNPAAHLLDAQGRLSPPPVWRGMRVTGVEGWEIFGPVQPAEDGIILREPTPATLREACEKVAGITLPDDLVDRCWRAARPELPYVPVGVLEAA